MYVCTHLRKSSIKYFLRLSGRCQEVVHIESASPACEHDQLGDMNVQPVLHAQEMVQSVQHTAIRPHTHLV